MAKFIHSCWSNSYQLATANVVFPSAGFGCPAVIWNILYDQEHEISPEDLLTAVELYLYFTHFFMSELKATVLLLETETTTSCDLYEIMKNCRDSV